MTFLKERNHLRKKFLESGRGRKSKSPEVTESMLELFII